MKPSERSTDESPNGEAKKGIKDMVSKNLLNTTQAWEAMEALEE
jgi:hypothetical protein